MAAMEDEVALLVNRLIDGFIDQGEVDFAKEFSVPFPSQVFLTLLGPAPRRARPFLTMKDGIIRPDHVTGQPYGTPVHAYQQKVADSIYDYFNRCSTSASRSAGRPALALPRRRGGRATG
jgi:cytochrome P450